ncbi:hypothetical protein ACFRCG_06410 [Embleya sp. NPDC056575]|uniref:hypothetical protein n=1 Tax=unclassified Embleya TaxID=2699296 RepID=UPI0036AD585A
MKKSVLATCTIALSFGGVMVAAPQASAGSNSQKIWSIGNNGASIKFEHNGDKITVCDVKADGKGAWGRFVTDDSQRLGGAALANGNGKCSTKSWDVPEGRRVIVEIWLNDNGVVSNTHNYTYATS